MPKIPVTPSRSHSSWVWKYAKKVDDVKFYCNLCEKEMKHSGNTTNALVHFRRKHPKEFEAATESRPEVSHIPIKRDDSRPVADLIKEEEVIHTDAEEMEILHEDEKDIVLELPQTATIGITIVDNETQFSSLRPIVEFIYKDLHCPSTILSAGFRQLMQSVNYPLPSVCELDAALIKEYAQKHVQLTNKIRQAESVAISLDFWSLTSTRKCVTITGHFIEPSCDLVSAVLSTREILAPLTWQNLAQEEFKKYHIQEKVTAIVAEYSNRILGVPEHVLIVQCFGELLQERISAFFLTVCQREIKCIKDNVAFIRSNERAYLKFEEERKKANGLPLIPIDDTDENCFAVWYALQRFLSLKDCITEAFKSFCQFPKPEDWTTISRLLAKLKPITSLIQSEFVGESYPTISKFSPLIQGLCARIPKDALGEGDTLIESLEGLAHDETFMKATLLDPRFKNLLFQDTEMASQVEKSIRLELSALLAKEGYLDEEDSGEEEEETKVTEENSFWSLLDEKVRESKLNKTTADGKAHEILQKYLSMGVLPRTQDPLNFWYNRRSTFPQLYRLAIKYLCIPAFCTPTNRIFTAKADRQPMELKRRLLPVSLRDEIIFLHGNQNL